MINNNTEQLHTNSLLFTTLGGFLNNENKGKRPKIKGPKEKKKARGQKEKESLWFPYFQN